MNNQEKQNKIKEKIETLIKKRSILGDDFDINEKHLLISPFDTEFDVFPELKDHSKDFQDFEASKNEYFRILYNAFSHHTANPSMPKNIERWDILYTFGNLEGKLNDLEPLNPCPEKVAEIVELLIKKAKDICDYKYNRDYKFGVIDDSTESFILGEGARVVLVGHRGVGKTTLNNYILNKFNRYAEDQGVIIVRIDFHLGLEHGLNLEDKIRWKILRVLFCYYDITNPVTKLRSVIKKKR